jgi:cell fate regulator YaaT (PSP1 superfamily)
MSDQEEQRLECLAEEGEEEGQQPSAPADKSVLALVDGKTLFRAKVLHSCAIEYCVCPPGAEAKEGGLVILPTRYGNEVARILGRVDNPKETGMREVLTVVRAATAVDIERFEENTLRERHAFQACREKIAARGLDMKLVSAHYLLEEQKVLFFFTAETRIDFRELVKDLVAMFKTRIELRQIGVRDEARVTGGTGICGRCLCCNSVTDRLRPVSIKMAKEQNLTLNSMKISGPCGRLLCCLAYEYDAYREAKQDIPPAGSRLRFEEEQFKVTEVNILTRRVRLLGESGRVLDCAFDSFRRNPESRAWELKEKA